jgi:RNA polymerase sigma factor (sigma-70 family)
MDDRVDVASEDLEQVIAEWEEEVRAICSEICASEPDGARMADEAFDEARRRVLQPTDPFEPIDETSLKARFFETAAKCAFERAIKPYSKKIWATCLSLCARFPGGREMAKDAFNETLRRAWQNWLKFDHSRGTRREAWLCRIAKNCAIAQHRERERYVRKLKNYAEQEAAEPTGGPSTPLEELINVENQAMRRGFLVWLYEILKTGNQRWLSKGECKIAIADFERTLSGEERLSAGELAKQLSSTEGSVNVRRSRHAKKIRDKLRRLQRTGQIPQEYRELVDKLIATP